MKRFVDQLYSSDTYLKIVDDGFCVVCPKCGGPGLVKGEREDGRYFIQAKFFKCYSCYYSQEQPRDNRVYKAAAFCPECERHVRVDIDGNYGGAVLNVTCPHCKAMVPAKTKKADNPTCHYGVNIDGLSVTEPNFGYELYFLSSFKGKAVFAYNRRHLQYLIDFIGADLREKPTRLGGITRHVPTFMKLAENRKDMLKILGRLQQK